jgi:predicted cation transporter
MELSLLFVVVLAVGLAVFLWWLSVLIEALKTPVGVWEASGQSQVAYVIVLVALGFIGALVYHFVARPRLSTVPRR